MKRGRGTTPGLANLPCSTTAHTLMIGDEPSMAQSRPNPISITLAGVEYAAPFLHLFREHTPDERSELLKSGEASGGWLAVPVLTYDSPVHGKSMIDGHTRTRLSNETGLPVAHMHLGAMSDIQAEHLARAVNGARRHLDAKEQADARAERQSRVLKLRSEGKSLRAIAETEGVSLPQVQRDIKGAGVSGDTPAKPTSVKGIDGKNYSVKEMLHDLRKTAPPSPKPTQSYTHGDDDSPLAAFPRSHPHADLAARIDGLMRAVQSVEPVPMSVVSHLRRARQSLYEAA